MQGAENKNKLNRYSKLPVNNGIEEKQKGDVAFAVVSVLGFVVQPSLNAFKNINTSGVYWMNSKANAK